MIIPAGSSVGASVLRPPLNLILHAQLSHLMESSVVSFLVGLVLKKQITKKNESVIKGLLKTRKRRGVVGSIIVVLLL